MNKICLLSIFSVTVCTALHGMWKDDDLFTEAYFDFNFGIKCNMSSPSSHSDFAGHENSVLRDVREFYNGNFDADYPLHVAVDAGKIGEVKRLIRAKAGIDQIAGGLVEITPLVIAVKNENTEMVKLLIECEADVNKKIAGLTPLYCAVKLGSVEIVKLLLGAKADPNECFVLHDAASRKNKQMASLLLVAGAKPNIRYGGRTPLHEAVLDSNKKPDAYALVQLLLVYGADSSVPDNRGETAVQYATEFHHIELAELLRQWLDFIKGLKLASRAFAMILHARCGHGSIAHGVYQSHIVHKILAYLKPGTSYVYDPREVAFYANMRRQQMDRHH